MTPLFDTCVPVSQQRKTACVLIWPKTLESGKLASVPLTLT